MVTNGSTATYTYPNAGSAHPHAPNSQSAIGTVTYDANGNRALDGSNFYGYDAENHPTSVENMGNATFPIQNSFDGDGARVARTTYVPLPPATTTTHFVGSWYENNLTTTTPTVYYPFNGMPVAMKQG